MNLDAYTIRKIAPRLLFAVIGVNISIYLCVAAIDITNVIGHGLAQLIKSPFDIAGSLDYTIDQGSANAAIAPLAVVGLLAAVPAMKGGALTTVFLLLLPVFVIILAALITLVLRQALLVLLTLASPVAIVLAVLPGTERFFKQWWQLFLSTLIVYPMIAALFAVSDVLTAISFDASNAGSNTAGAVNVISGILFAFLPIAMIPFTFKASGGAMAAAMNASAGVRGAANRYAMGQLQKNWTKGGQDIRGGGLFTNTRQRASGKVDKYGNPIMESYGVRHRLNRGSSRLANLDKMKMTRMRSSLNNAMQIAHAERAKSILESNEGKLLDGFDDEHFINANSDGSAADMARVAKERAPERYDEDYVDPKTGQAPSEQTKAMRRKNLANTVSQLQDFNKVGGAAAGRAASTVALHGISTSYKDTYYKLNPETGEIAEKDGKKLIWKEGVDDEALKSEVVAKSSHDQMQDTIARVSGNDIGLGNWLTAESIKGAKGAGRYDMAASASAVLLYQEAMRSGDKKTIEDAGKYYKKMMRERITPAQMMQGHPRAAEAMANVLGEHIEDLSSQMNSGTMKGASLEEMRKLQEDMVKTWADIGGVQDVLAGSGSEAVSHVQKKILGKKTTGMGTVIKEIPDYVKDSGGRVVYDTDMQGRKVAKVHQEPVKDAEGKIVGYQDRKIKIKEDQLLQRTGEEWLTSIRDNPLASQRRHEWRREGLEGAEAEGAEAAAQMAREAGQIEKPNQMDPLGK
ncbi:MAG TPA: hypothetical protein VD947_00840 [Patescibacteria group bacterium]|nr:hypothetical protein [Patescibacteria group bacterium]